MALVTVTPASPALIPPGLQALEVGLDMRLLGQTGPCVAFAIDAVPVWLAGIHRLWPQVGVIWQLVLDAEAVARHTLALLRCVRRTWQAWHHEEAWRWLEAYIALEDAVSRRFVTWLGFTELIRKPQFGPHGETVVVYAWTKGDTDGA